MLSPRDFHYDLPAERIAQTPAVPRDSSRLLVVNRETGELHHHHFRELPSLLRPTDILVRNNTKVIPARIFGRKKSGGEVEILLAKRLSSGSATERWECLTKPGLKPCQTVVFDNVGLEGSCVEITGFSRVIEFNQSHTELFESLDTIGHTPLPPYIEWHGDDPQELRQLYQTLYAKVAGSAAAPTAGLHFTPAVDQALTQLGVEIHEVTLHVGLGTFLRVKVDDITQHEMHAETYSFSAETAAALNAAHRAGRRIISVGTTTTRVLETCFDHERHQFVAGSGETKIFIYPPYRFEAIDGLITNFHEPDSTLLMLVSAFVTQPNTSHSFTSFADTTLGAAYQVALQQDYRFLSFGDAMLIT